MKLNFHLEPEGLTHGIKFLESQALVINTFVSDCHMQIRKWVKENLPHTQHYFDIWHVAKGISFIFFIIFFYFSFFFIFHIYNMQCKQLTNWYLFVEIIFSALFHINEVNYWGQNLLLPDFTQWDVPVLANFFIIVEITSIMFLL